MEATVLVLYAIQPLCLTRIVVISCRIGEDGLPSPLSADELSLLFGLVAGLEPAVGSKSSPTVGIYEEDEMVF